MLALHWEVVLKYFLFICIFGLYTLTFSTNKSSIDSAYEEAVREEVARVYSSGWDDEEFGFSKENDIWGLVNSEPEEECDAFIEGYANRPSSYGKIMYQFWVCVKVETSGELSAEIWDDIQVAD